MNNAKLNTINRILFRYDIRETTITSHEDKYLAYCWCLPSYKPFNVTYKGNNPILLASINYTCKQVVFRVVENKLRVSLKAQYQESGYGFTCCLLFPLDKVVITDDTTNKVLTITYPTHDVLTINYEGFSTCPICGATISGSNNLFCCSKTNEVLYCESCR